MSAALNVYRSELPVGELLKIAAEGYEFHYRPEYSRNPGATLALPLQPEPFSSGASRAFFANLLPEGQLRDYYARKFSASPEDDFTLLEAVGGDCAGAASLYPHQSTPPQRFQMRTH